MAAIVPIIVAGLAILGGFTYGPAVKRVATLLGVTRADINTTVELSGDIVYISDTTHCEDIHHHIPSGLLFTACEDDPETRASWFPPLGNFGDPIKARDGKGSIHIVDPEDMSTKRLKFENFDSAFVTHGIDVITDPENSEAVYVFAVNHVPDPEYLAAKLAGQYAGQKAAQKAQSRIEIFHHVLGSSTINHLRSVLHPLVKTPNDIFVKDPRSFYVTNDHFYREGAMRLIEDVWPGASWTDTIHVRIKELSAQNATDGVVAEVAYQGMRNSNGLGHYTPGHILIDDCAGGTMHIGKLSSDPKNATIQVVESVSLDSYVDNPSWFEDPYRSEAQDASGFVLPGLSRPIDIPKHVRDPSANVGSIVWYVKPVADCKTAEKADCWEKRVLFQDDGRRIRSAASALLVAIDPAKENGRRKAWLFISGFFSSNVVAVKVDL